MIDKIKRVLGLVAEEDPLKREIEEMRREAKRAKKVLERLERGKRAKKAVELEEPDSLFPG